MWNYLVAVRCSIMMWSLFIYSVIRKMVIIGAFLLFKLYITLGMKSCVQKRKEGRKAWLLAKRRKYLDVTFSFLNVRFTITLYLFFCAMSCQQHTIMDTMFFFFPLYSWLMNHLIRILQQFFLPSILLEFFVFKDR